MTDRKNSKAASRRKLAAAEFEPLGLEAVRADDRDHWDLTFTALTAARSFGEMGHEQAAAEARRLREEDGHDPKEMVDWFDTSISRLKTALESFETGRLRLRSGIARAATA